MNNREWLYGMEPSDLAAWFDAEHVEPNDGIKPESVVKPQSVDANDSLMDLDSCTHGMRTFASETDSREKLEADKIEAINSFLREHHGAISWNDELRLMSDEWLDRQAAITANETSHDNPYVGLVRGKQWERTEISDYYCGRCGWKVTDHDSYCPECGGALHKAPNKPDGKFDARKTAEMPETCATKEHIRDFDDSREKLEADVRKHYAYSTTTLMYPPSANKTTDMLCSLSVDTVIGWLDRQAAITERECREYEDALREQHHKRISELKRERDDLKAQIDEILAGDKATDAINAELVAKVKDLENQVEVWMDAAGNAHDMWEKADSRRVEVERECDSLVIDLADCERVIADLRDKLSRACDNAHDTLRMMDEGLA